MGKLRAIFYCLLLFFSSSARATPAQEVANYLQQCRAAINNTGFLWHRRADARGTLDAAANGTEAQAGAPLDLTTAIGAATEAQFETVINEAALSSAVESLVVANFLYMPAQNGFPSRGSDQEIARWVGHNFFGNLSYSADFTAPHAQQLILIGVQSARLNWQKRRAQPLTAAQAADDIRAFAGRFNQQCEAALQTSNINEDLHQPIVGFLNEHPEYRHIFVTQSFRQNIFNLQANFNRACGNASTRGQTQLFGGRLPGFNRLSAEQYREHITASFAQAQNDLGQYLRELVVRNNAVQNPGFGLGDMRAAAARRNLYSFIKEQPELLGEVIQQSPAKLRRPYSVLLCQRFRDITDADFWRTIAVSTAAGGAAVAATVLSGGAASGLAAVLLTDTLAGASAAGADAWLTYANTAQMTRAQSLNAARGSAASVVARAVTINREEQAIGDRAAGAVLLAPVAGQAVRPLVAVAGPLIKGLSARARPQALGDLAAIARGRQTSSEVIEQGAREIAAAHPTPPGRILSFEGVNGKDVYNITAPFRTRFQGRDVEIIAGRVEARDSEHATIMFFTRSTRNGKEVWTPLAGARDFPMLQDPFVSQIGDELTFGGVQIIEENGRIVSYYTSFYRGKSLDQLKHFADGPKGMKDIRLIQLRNGRIGVFTRPQGDVGGKGKVGYTEIASLDQLSQDIIRNAPLLEDMARFFGQDVWGGVNAAYLLDDGRIGVLAHLAYWTGEGTKTASRNYYSASFIFDPAKRVSSNLKILATRDLLPKGPSKRADLQNVIFSGGLKRADDGSYTLCGGAGDAQGFCLRIENPFR